MELQLSKYGQMEDQNTLKSVLIWNFFWQFNKLILINNGTIVFFAPYHGYSICDGVAAHAKGILNRTSRDEHIPIRTTELAISTIQKLNNHFPSSVDIPSNDFSTPTMHGIKKHYRFTFSKDKNKIYAYLNNDEEKINKEYHPQKLISLLNIEFE